LLLAEGKNPSPQFLSSVTSRADKPDSGILVFFLNLLESLVPAMAYTERLEKSVKLIKKETERDGSTPSALKDGEGFYKEAKFAHSDSVFY